MGTEESQEKSNQYKPELEETLGAYLKRLRKVAGGIRGRRVSLDRVGEMAKHLPAPQSFTSAWLAVAESDGYQRVGGDKLRTLASIYSELLQTTIKPEWLLAKAGFEIRPAAPQEDDKISELLRNDDVLALIDIVGQLIEKGYEEDVRLLVTLAHRYLNARDPKAQPGAIFDDSTLSVHVEKYMKALGLAS